MPENPRKPFEYPAWIDIGDGTPRRKCNVDSISKSGASLTVETADNLPHLFVLHLSDTGTVQRDCRRTWQDHARAGVEFIGPQPRISDLELMRQLRDIVHKCLPKAGSEIDASLEPFDLGTLEPFDLDTLKS